MSNSSKVNLIGERSNEEAFLLALTPCEYFENYCRVNNRRHTLYRRVFDKYKDSEGELNVKVKLEQTTVRSFQ